MTNHDAVAIAAHRALNPHTRHLQADIYEVDPVEATRGRALGILWASPDCRDHSVAKGGAPRSPRVRSMPWQICRWVGMLRRRGLGPDVVYLENVREIRGWGPLVAKRDPATGRVLRLDGTVAANGERVPRREQQLVRDKRRIGRTYRAWMRHIRGLGAEYQDRDLCCADFGVPTSRRRLFGVASLDGLPIVWPTVTHGPRNSEAVQSGRLRPHRAAAEIIDWSLPLPSIFDRKRPLAAATMRRVATGMTRFVLEAAEPFLVHLTHHGERQPVSTSNPLPTVTGAHRGEMAVVGPMVVPVCHTGDGRVHDGADPLATMTANGVGPGGKPGCGIPIGVVGAMLVQIGYGERDGQAPRALDIEAPIGTQVAGGAKHAVIGAWLAQHNTGLVGHDPRDAVSTLTTAGTQQQVAAAYLAEFRGTSADGQPVTDPAPTACTGGGRGGNHTGVTAAFLAEYYGTGGQHQAIADPLNTLTTVPRFAVTGADTMTPPLTNTQITRARQVAEFLRAHGAWANGEFVTFGRWIVVDIGMRMLTPAEAAAAHELRMPEFIEIAGKRRPLTKSEAIRGRRQVSLLAGPFSTHAAALALVDRARDEASRLDPWSDFDMVGTLKRTGRHHPRGVLNGRLGLETSANLVAAE